MGTVKHNRKIKQVEDRTSGIFHVINVSETVDPGKSPGGYFIEKSRKTELYLIQQKKDKEEREKNNPVPKKPWFQKLKEWFFG